MLPDAIWGEGKHVQRGQVPPSPLWAALIYAKVCIGELITLFYCDKHASRSIKMLESVSWNKLKGAFSVF
jgi:hypothetical protein